MGETVVYLYSALTAILLASGQAIWKKAASKLPTLQQQGLSSFQAGIRIIFSPEFMFGAVLYVAATLAYLWLLSKFPFYIVQTTLVSFSILFSIFVSKFIFQEAITLINFAGVLLIILGAALVTWKK